MPRVRDRRVRLARTGAAVALAVSGGLLAGVIAVHATAMSEVAVALTVLTPAIAGGMLAWALPRSRVALFAAAALVFASATLLLIGLAGLLYVPSIALFLVAAARRDHQAATSPGVREHVR